MHICHVPSFFEIVMIGEPHGDVVVLMAHFHPMEVHLSRGHYLVVLLGLVQHSHVITSHTDIITINHYISCPQHHNTIMIL